MSPAEFCRVFLLKNEYFSRYIVKRCYICVVFTIYRNKMIKREQFIKPIRPFYEITDLVKVIIGIRRSGKSVMLSQIAQEIRSMGISEDQIISINFELYEYSHLKESQELHSYLISKIINKKTYYVFFDEIQLVEGFELVVNSIRARGNVSIFITGSNAHLLSGELATHLSGRYVKFLVTPFTFNEFLQLPGRDDLKKAFSEYMKWGGMPGRFAFNTEIETQKYLQDVFDSVILRDIVQRSGLRDVNLLDNIIQFLIENTGQIFSANTISKYLKSQSRSISADALYSYIDYTLSSLLFNKVNRYDIKGKNVFATLEKYYIADLGLLQLKRGFVNENLGARLETIVANELIAKGYRINVGIKRNAEIDFIAEKAGEVEYIQVAYSIDSDKTLEREISAFEGIPEKKILITADEYDYSGNGIKSVNIINWLTVT